MRQPQAHQPISPRRFCRGRLLANLGLRKDFFPAAKLQMEDDITASVLVPARDLEHVPETVGAATLKFVENCEQRLFQRPDDAIHHGYDQQTEADFARPDNFFSNYEPLTPTDARELVEDSIGFYQFTEPLQGLIREAAGDSGATYFVSSAHPRLVDGKPSKNPRYLQRRPDLLNPQQMHLSELAARLRRRIPPSQPIY